ncbi:RIP metalloprotease RseP [Pedosphaera parvula]|uniref:Zinc metalloprotease n=1 Tax=Pedosphaera parvula (strain Ellin514) TaxID=320771 RepID=B9XS09_PEDPL|nr:RIP metalloprotease RseP [Pedosphaera parvula]EEF57380.1 membrane-associated zinc metalloprotease [Pedosphaera parvula Ellin514]
MHYLKPVFIILEVLVLFNLLIFVHELGHFLAARWRGLKVDRFAIWFGKPIWKTKINGVEYALGSIPAGGYVSLPQMAPMEMIEGKSSEKSSEPLPPISALDKIIVAFAGPLFSFGLALVFALVVWQVGRPVTEAETSTTVGYVYKDGPAEQAGLKPGDEILKVDGKPVTKFGGMGDSISWRVVRSEGVSVPIEIKRFNEETKTKETKTIDVKPKIEEGKAWQRKGLRQILIEPAQSSIVAKVYSNSPAALAGLKPKDEIAAVNGKKPIHYALIGEMLEKNGDKPVELTVVREGTNFSVSIKPEMPLNPTDEQKKPMLGILWLDGGKATIAYPHPLEQIDSSVNAMISTFSALFSKKSDIKPQHLGGAVKIGEVYYHLFSNENGWRLAIWFSVLMNINLAILNMLPFPVLDGGHITLALIESIRRRPVSAWILNYVQTGCAVLLIGYMLYIAFFDVQDLLPGGGAKNRQSTSEIKFAPKTESVK